MMEFIGTKRVMAEPMTRGEYNDYRGWALPEGENSEDPGFVVKYDNDYVSWTPAAVFYKHYQAQPIIAEHSVEDVVTEEMINARGLNARRVSLTELHGSISSIEVIKHVTKVGNILRFAVLIMDNGFCVTGRPSVAISVENDNDEVGVRIAIRNAVHELWQFVGFRVVEGAHNARND